MKKHLKAILKSLGVSDINNLATYSRYIYYSTVDIFGYLLFLLIKNDKFAHNKINKILIIRLDRIGDLVLSTPAIKAVRSTFKDAEIHLMVPKYTKDLVCNNPNISKLLIYKEDKLCSNYDLAIALHPGFKQNYLTYKSGAKIRVGYSGQGGSFFLTFKQKDDRAVRIRHEVESVLEVAGLIGCKTDNKELEVSITDEGERFADEFINKNCLSDNDLIIGIQAGSRQSHIRWKKEGFAEVANRLMETYNAKVILFGGSSEKTLIDSISSLMGKQPVVALNLSLTQLVSTIKRCNLFISNSTGPMHIAAALKVPVIAIFGNIHPLDSYQEWGPWGKGHVVVSKNLNCPDCHPTDCMTFDCMNLITANEVMDAVVRQFEAVSV
jgi:ADP-heptose:LPS heptosyltransferase